MTFYKVSSHSHFSLDQGVDVGLDLGAGAEKGQRSRVKKWFSEIVLCVDADTAAPRRHLVVGFIHTMQPQQLNL